MSKEMKIESASQTRISYHRRTKNLSKYRLPHYIKRAFLFCCFCGIRHCDIAALTWKDLKKDKEGKYTLNMTQQKTKIAISIPLSGEAIKQLPPKGNSEPTNKVFADLINGQD